MRTAARALALGLVTLVLTGSCLYACFGTECEITCANGFKTTEVRQLYDRGAPARL